MTHSVSYPEQGAYEPPHPAFTKRAEVLSQSDGRTIYDVDLANGTCTCKHGKAFRWDDKRGWVRNNWCSHKMRAAAIVIEGLTGPERYNAQTAYNRLLGERYIVWESVSAFHKELRRGDHEAAQYWALSVAAHRGGMQGVIKYLCNIHFEESRDLDLYTHLLNLREKGSRVGYVEAMNAVKYFALTPKKWQLDGRLKIFTDEMSGYSRLAQKYGYAVAKGKDIIEPTAFDTLRREFIEGYQTADNVRAQTGVKGLFKSQFVRGHDALKVTIFNLLTDCLNDEGPFSKTKNAFSYDHDYATRVHALVYRRFTTFREIGYHELNALADALAGEQYPSGANTLPRTRQRILRVSPAAYAPPPGRILQIPLYALDNHNYRGKALMSRWGATELQPGAAQLHLDFRICGAYMGVAWRYLAWNQFKSIDVPWGKVRWYPSWLWKHLDSMWY